MKIDFEDLKRDFEAIGAKKEEESQNYAGNDLVESVCELALAPALCGVYFSRLDIKVIGLKFGEDVQIRERKRMLRDILRAVTSKEELWKIVEIIIESAHEKAAVYDELCEKFPSSREIFQDYKKRIGDFEKRLRQVARRFEKSLFL